MRSDVTGNGRVDLLDAIAIVNRINGSAVVGAFFDVNVDRDVTLFDVFVVVNEINRNARAITEGESATFPSPAALIVACDRVTQTDSSVSPAAREVTSPVVRRSQIIWGLAIATNQHQIVPSSPTSTEFGVADEALIDVLDELVPVLAHR